MHSSLLPPKHAYRDLTSSQAKRLTCPSRVRPQQRSHARAKSDVQQQEHRAPKVRELKTYVESEDSLVSSEREVIDETGSLAQAVPGGPVSERPDQRGARAAERLRQLAKPLKINIDLRLVCFVCNPASLFTERCQSVQKVHYMLVCGETTPVNVRLRRICAFALDISMRTHLTLCACCCCTSSLCRGTRSGPHKFCCCPSVCIGAPATASVSVACPPPYKARV
jgi:hypothetical protein